ncbi:unnamed protein product [Pleuronectes platessa]|uniref:Small integral membrane protein 6 n=1 Tax=Pleuronectes platessa TaxID=8262 RepID=A0A9N7VAZ0_PLEPL|nr:unnamed protein product [Pleuronectes platessa]
MAVHSVSELENPTESPEEWVEWFLHRVNQEPWALGGVVVIGFFVLGILSLVVFALVYGCCCSSTEENQKKRKPKKDGVI